MSDKEEPEAREEALRRYLVEIERYRQLSPEEELELAESRREGDRAARILRGEQSLTAERRLELESKARAGRASVRTLVESNLRLVVSIAKSQPVIVGMDQRLDLIREGNWALLRAAREFEPGGEMRFAAYARPRVRSAIERRLEN